MTTYMVNRIKRIFYHNDYLKTMQLHDFIHLISNYIDIGIWILEESNLELTYENSKGTEIINESEFMTVKNLIIEKNLSNFEEEIYRDTIELKNISQIGKKYFFASVKKYIYLGINSLFVVFFDVTPVKTLEIENSKMSKAKENVMASVSHDIRTPLNASISMNELALKETTNPKTKFKLEIALKSSKLLLYFISDFLDFHKLGKMQIVTNSNKTFIQDIVKEIVELFYTIIRLRGLEFFFEINVNPLTEIFTDELKLKRILINLISNAMKYTLKGYISLRVDVLKFGTDFFLKFSIIDTGIGISVENIEKIFEKFGQVNDLGNENNDILEHGIGLGLTISNEMIKCINPNQNLNKIFVDSQLGEGSVFCFFLPLVAYENPKIVSSNWEKPKFELGTVETLKRASDEYLSKHIDHLLFELINDSQFFLLQDYNTIPIFHFENGIMIVDDEETNIIVLKMYLHDFPRKIAFLRNGKEAVDFFKRICEKKVLISKIFMDLNMPVMNGKDATIEIRNLEKIFKRNAVDIIALTANTIEIGEENNLLNFGFTSYEIKPVSKENFLKYF